MLRALVGLAAVLIAVIIGLTLTRSVPMDGLRILSIVVLSVLLLAATAVTRYAIDRQDRENERRWWALVNMLTEERLHRIDIEALQQAIDDERASRYETTTFPFRLKPEDSPDASGSVWERQERLSRGD